MTVVNVEIGGKPADRPDVEFIADLDSLVGPNKCSCTVGDDQPY